MPNHIKNRIEIIGDLNLINELIEEFSTYHHAEINKTDNGLFICRAGEGHGFGWLNSSTGEFERRNEKTVIGIPEGWKVEVNDSFLHFPDFNKIIPQPSNIFKGNLGEKEREMCLREGRPNWYDWNIENWGTKWGAYSCQKIALNIYTFETAWSAVPKLIDAMAMKYPDLKVEYKWADEDTGYNVGFYIYHNGKVEMKQIEGGSREAYELAFELRPDIKELYHLVDGEYEYIEE